MKNRELKEAWLGLLGCFCVIVILIAVNWFIKKVMFSGIDSPESRLITALPTMGIVLGATLVLPFSVINLLYRLVKLFSIKSTKK